VYIVVKFVQRQRFLRGLRIARITAEELRRRLELADETLAVVDTRSALDVEATPYGVPGALWIPAEEIERRHAEVPRGREIILYCS
jgi:rhodanese-related sulfurtransferase